MTMRYIIFTRYIPVPGEDLQFECRIALKKGGDEEEEELLHLAQYEVVVISTDEGENKYRKY